MCQQPNTPYIVQEILTQTGALVQYQKKYSTINFTYVLFIFYCAIFVISNGPLLMVISSASIILTLFTHTFLCIRFFLSFFYLMVQSPMIHVYIYIFGCNGIFLHRYPYNGCIYQLNIFFIDLILFIYIFLFYFLFYTVHHGLL